MNAPSQDVRHAAIMGAGISAAIGLAFIDAEIAVIQREIIRERVLWRLLDAGVSFEEASKIARDEADNHLSDKGQDNG